VLELRADVLVVGGGLGGVAAALAACRAGRDVALTEETDSLGSQLTSQAVPPDEHPWIEQFGATAAYREVRDGIREHYRRWYPLRAEAARLPGLAEALDVRQDTVVIAADLDLAQDPAAAGPPDLVAMRRP
jgi:NADPH-dependent 2,4-dienoyl-CoA reductase/sulfur reductase-like enzyme